MDVVVPARVKEEASSARLSNTEDPIRRRRGVALWLAAWVNVEATLILSARKVFVAESASEYGTLVLSSHAGELSHSSVGNAWCSGSEKPAITTRPRSAESNKDGPSKQKRRGRLRNGLDN